MRKSQKFWDKIRDGTTALGTGTPQVPDPTVPFDAYGETDDTEEAAKAGYLKGTGR